MCNLYAAGKSAAEVAAPFSAKQSVLPLAVKSDVRPIDPGYVVRRVEGALTLDVMRWGFPGMKGNPGTNARDLTRGLWRWPLERPEQRCLVPVTAFCEYSGEKGRKVQHWFALPAEPLFAFAGLWRLFEGEPRFTFATTGYLGDPAKHIIGTVHPKRCR